MRMLFYPKTGPEPRWAPDWTDEKGNPGFKFRTDLNCVEATGYFVGKDMIAAAAHTILGNGESNGIKAKDLTKWYCVFGLTEEYCALPTEHPLAIPVENVFDFDR